MVGQPRPKFIQIEPAPGCTPFVLERHSSSTGHRPEIALHLLPAGLSKRVGRHCDGIGGGDKASVYQHCSLLIIHDEWGHDLDAGDPAVPSSPHYNVMGMIVTPPYPNSSFCQCRIKVVRRQFHRWCRSRLSGKDIGGPPLSQPAYLPNTQAGADKCYQDEARRQQQPGTIARQMVRPLRG